MKTDFEYLEDFKKSNFKGLFILKQWIGPAGKDVYNKKEIAYYLGTLLGMFFILSKFLPNNYNIIIDHINILNFLNVILIFVFLIIIGLLTGFVFIITIDLVILIFKYLGKKIKKKLFTFSESDFIQLNIYKFINITSCIGWVIIFVIAFLGQVKNNDATIKTTGKEPFIGTIEYYSGENYIIRQSTGYLVIPKDKVEYIFYPKIEQPKTGTGTGPQ